jgi:hypothetical protein
MHSSDKPDYFSLISASWVSGLKDNGHWFTAPIGRSAPVLKAQMNASFLITQNKNNSFKFMRLAAIIPSRVPGWDTMLQYKSSLTQVTSFSRIFWVCHAKVRGRSVC